MIMTSILSQYSHGGNFFSKIVICQELSLEEWDTKNVTPCTNTRWYYNIKILNDIVSYLKKVIALIQICEDIISYTVELQNNGH